MSKKGLDFKCNVMNKKFLLIAVLMLSSIGMFAQAQFSLYAGGAFPMGKFKQGELKDKYPAKWALMDEKGDKGFAGIGFNVGLDVLLPISAVDGLGITIGADYFYNSYNSELKDYFSDLTDDLDEQFDSYTLKKPRVMNVPIMVGARYLYEVSDMFGVFGEAGIGANWRKITSYKVTGDIDDSDMSTEMLLKYDSSVTFAFKLGVGIMLAQHFSIGLDYYNLGGAKVKGKYTEKVDDEESDPVKFKGKALKCSEFVVRLGYHF